jgi:bifunctional DNA-binding transcriptional regulator/antitoxin component of YhaV-PrlF toxin-antitoxin module
MVRTSITSKGQTTIPVEFRKKWNTSEVIWELHEDGSANVRPVPDVMSLFGAAHDGKPRDSREKAKAREAMGRAASRKP